MKERIWETVLSIFVCATAFFLIARYNFGHHTIIVATGEEVLEQSGLAKMMPYLGAILGLILGATGLTMRGLNGLVAIMEAENKTSDRSRPSSSHLRIDPALCTHEWNGGRYIEKRYESGTEIIYQQEWIRHCKHCGIEENYSPTPRAIKAAKKGMVATITTSTKLIQ
jgi:hypothetical protein